MRATIFMLTAVLVMAPGISAAQMHGGGMHGGSSGQHMMGGQGMMNNMGTMSNMMREIQQMVHKYHMTPLRQWILTSRRPSVSSPLKTNLTFPKNKIGWHSP